jgi:hypothetical protein
MLVGTVEKFDEQVLVPEKNEWCVVIVKYIAMLFRFFYEYY